MTTSEFRVLIADDHAWARDQIRRALEEGGVAVCGEGASAADAVRLTEAESPDVVLLDIHMPGGGVEAAREISRRWPELPIVMLTNSHEDDDLFDSLRAGASGYLLKDADPAQLADMLRTALAGEAPLSPGAAVRVLDELRSPRRGRLSRDVAERAGLSDREWEVIVLVAEGLSSNRIAERLHLAPATVRVHVSAVIKKLRVTDRAAAIEALTADRARNPVDPSLGR